MHSTHILAIGMAAWAVSAQAADTSKADAAAKCTAAAANLYGYANWREKQGQEVSAEKAHYAKMTEKFMNLTAALSDNAYAETRIKTYTDEYLAHVTKLGRESEKEFYPTLAQFEKQCETQQLSAQ